MEIQNYRMGAGGLAFISGARKLLIYHLGEVVFILGDWYRKKAPTTATCRHVALGRSDGVIGSNVAFSDSLELEKCFCVWRL